MKKRVNVEPVGPIYTLRVPITGKIINHEMSTGDILNCIYARAKVDEILPSGKLVRLNLSNYNKDNSILEEKVELPKVTEEVTTTPIPEPVKPVEKIEEKVEEKVEEPVKEEEPKQEEEPETVSEPATVVNNNNNKNNGKRNK